MIDTIAASITFNQPIDERLFDGRREYRSGERVPMLKLWRNTEKFRITYTRSVLSCIGARLRLEFSVPHFNHLTFRNPSVGDVGFTLQQLSLLLRALLDQDVPAIKQWSVRRVDYAWNWEVGDDAALYLQHLSGLRMSGYGRTDWDQSGAQWKGKRANGRVIKWYHKGIEQGEPDRGVIRFEASHHRKAAAYLAAQVFGCEPTVGEMVKPGRALYALGLAWERLGVPGRWATLDRAGLLRRLHDLYGSSAAQALYALECIQQYGRACVPDLLSENTYYRWRKLLKRDGLSGVHEGVALPPLHLPADSVLDALNARQNLGAATSMVLGGNEKIWWEKLSALLQIKPGRPASQYLLERAYAYCFSTASHVDGLPAAAGFSLADSVAADPAYLDRLHERPGFIQHPGHRTPHEFAPGD